MTKVKWSLATDPNDPIFSGKWVISSRNYRKNGSKPADPSLVDAGNEDKKAVDLKKTKPKLNG